MILIDPCSDRHGTSIIERRVALAPCAPPAIALFHSTTYYCIMRIRDHLLWYINQAIDAHDLRMLGFSRQICEQLLTSKRRHVVYHSIPNACQAAAVSMGQLRFAALLLFILPFPGKRFFQARKIIAARRSRARALKVIGAMACAHSDEKRALAKKGAKYAEIASALHSREKEWHTRIGIVFWLLTSGLVLQMKQDVSTMIDGGIEQSKWLILAYFGVLCLIGIILIPATAGWRTMQVPAKKNRRLLLSLLLAAAMISLLAFVVPSHPYDPLSSVPSYYGIYFAGTGAHLANMMRHAFTRAALMWTLALTLRCFAYVVRYFIWRLFEIRRKESTTVFLSAQIIRCIDEVDFLHKEWESTTARIVSDELCAIATRIEIGLLAQLQSSYHNIGSPIYKWTREIALPYRNLALDVIISSPDKLRACSRELQANLYHMLSGHLASLTRRAPVTSQESRLRKNASKAGKAIRQILTSLLPLGALCAYIRLGGVLSTEVQAYAFSATALWAIVGMMILLDPDFEAKLEAFRAFRKKE